jgi:hypothetical protein
MLTGAQAMLTGARKERDVALKELEVAQTAVAHAQLRAASTQRTSHADRKRARSSTTTDGYASRFGLTTTVPWDRFDRHIETTLSQVLVGDATVYCERGLFPPREWVFVDVQGVVPEAVKNLKVSKPQVVAVHGLSGAGKSCYAFYQIPAQVFSEDLKAITLKLLLSEDEIKTSFQDIFESVQAAEDAREDPSRLQGARALRDTACEEMIRRLIEAVLKVDISKPPASPLPYGLCIVFDEIGNFAPLCRGLVSAREKIYGLLLRTFKEAIVVVCGTGGELIFDPDLPKALATDVSGLRMTFLAEPSAHTVSEMLDVYTAKQKEAKPDDSAKIAAFAKELVTTFAFTAFSTNMRALALLLTECNFTVNDIATEMKRATRCVVQDYVGQNGLSRFQGKSDAKLSIAVDAMGLLMFQGRCRFADDAAKDRERRHALVRLGIVVRKTLVLDDLSATEANPKDLAKWSRARMNGTVPSPPNPAPATALHAPACVPHVPACVPNELTSRSTEAEIQAYDTTAAKCVDHHAVYETSAAVMLVLFYLAESPTWSPIVHWEDLEHALVQLLQLRALVIKKGLVPTSVGDRYGHVADIVAPFVTADQCRHLVGAIAPFASELKVESITFKKPFPRTKGTPKLKDLPDTVALSETPSAVVIKNGRNAPFFNVAFMCRLKTRDGADVVVGLRLRAEFTSIDTPLSDSLCSTEAETLGIDEEGEDSRSRQAEALKKKVCCGDASVREEVAGCIVAPMNHSWIADGDGFEWRHGVSVITAKAKERLYPLSLLCAPRAIHNRTGA